VLLCDEDFWSICLSLKYPLVKIDRNKFLDPFSMDMEVHFSMSRWYCVISICLSLKYPLVKIDCNKFLDPFSRDMEVHFSMSRWYCVTKTSEVFV
jgi:hypothetical protein